MGEIYPIEYEGDIRISVLTNKKRKSSKRGFDKIMWMALISWLNVTSASSDMIF